MRKGLLCTIAENGRYTFAFLVCFSFFLPGRAPYLPTFLFFFPLSLSFFLSPRHSGTTIYSIAPAKLRPQGETWDPGTLSQLIKESHFLASVSSSGWRVAQKAAQSSLQAFLLVLIEDWSLSSAFCGCRGVGCHCV